MVKAADELCRTGVKVAAFTPAMQSSSFPSEFRRLRSPPRTLHGKRLRFKQPMCRQSASPAET